MGAPRLVRRIGPMLVAFALCLWLLFVGAVEFGECNPGLFVVCLRRRHGHRVSISRPASFANINQRNLGYGPVRDASLAVIPAHVF